MIRHAMPADRLRIVQMARDFHSASGLAVPFDPIRCAAAAGQAIHRDDAVALLWCTPCTHAVGMLCAQAIAHPALPVSVAIDWALWLEPEARSLRAANALVEAFEAWCAERDAVPGLVDRDGRAGVFYRRRGYRPLETIYARGL